MTTQTFPITQPISLDVRIRHGSLTVTALENLSEASVSLAARTERSDILDRTTVELRGSTLHIRAPRHDGVFELLGDQAREAIDIEVLVPSGTPLKIRSDTAEVTLIGRCGAADTTCGSAELTADHIDGDLRLRHGSGNCQVERVTGSVQTRSGSGAARFGEVGGALNSVCGSGQFDIGAIHGTVRLRVGSGCATLGAIYNDIDVTSGSGELSIGVPAGVPARLDLTTGSGRVHPQLEISQTSPKGGRAITIRARTGSGDIHLFRAVA